MKTLLKMTKRRIFHTGMCINDKKFISEENEILNHSEDSKCHPIIQGGPSGNLSLSHTMYCGTISFASMPSFKGTSSCFSGRL